MVRRIGLLVGVGAALMAAGAGVASAQMDGPPAPDGPMQGLMREHARSTLRFETAFDINRDGKVTHDELNRSDGARFAAATHGAPAMTLEQFTSMSLRDFQQHTAEMFRRLDWNGDGKLSLDEYAGPQRVRFETLDRDGRGSESCAPNPVRSAAFQPGSSRGGFGRARFCAENDLNRDGQVTRQEFDTAMAKHFSTLTAGAKTMTEPQFASDALMRFREIAARIFKRLDTNKDDKLSIAEFAAPDQKMFARLDKNHDGAVTSDELFAHHARADHKHRGSNG